MTTRPSRIAASSVLALSLLLTLVGCGGGSSGSSAASTGAVTAAGPPSAQTVTVDTTDKLQFVPNEIDAKVGTLMLTLTNTGQVSHNLVFDDMAQPKIGTIVGGRTLKQTYTFSKPGTYRFVCTFHPGMDGKLVVTAAS